MGKEHMSIVLRHTIVYQQGSVWLFRPKNWSPAVAGDKFSHDYPSAAAANESAKEWEGRQEWFTSR